jgi:hypothetical protein
MTRREIAALCCRIVALIVLAWALTYLVQVIPALNSALANTGRGAGPGYFSAVMGYGMLGCTLLLFAMTLWWNADAISRWMAPEDSVPVTGPELSADALMSVASLGVGLFAITRAAPTFFRFATSVALTQTSLDDFWRDDEWKVALASDALLTAWGAWLIFGNRGLVRIVKWARIAGKEPPQTGSESTTNRTLPPREVD